MLKLIKYRHCVLLLVTLTSCAQQQVRLDSITNVVGEIFHDQTIDDDNFKICSPQNQIIQYYAFNEKTFSGEKVAIIEYFNKQYKVPNNNTESGYIRIRFIVNCQGISGRFRLLQSDLEYQPKSFSKGISNQLLKITKSLNGWKSMSANGIARDYYQYLIFKIEKGQLIEILP